MNQNHSKMTEKGFNCKKEMNNNETFTDDDNDDDYGKFFKELFTFLLYLV
jgi:hypothetical protein